MLNTIRDEAASQSAFMPALGAAVSTLAQLVRPSATVFYWVGADNEPSGFELFGMAETMHRTYLQRYCTLDPMHPSRFSMQTGSVLTLAGALPETARGGSVYWRRFLNPHQVVDVMEVLLRDGTQGTQGTRPVAAFSLLRMAPAEAFSVNDQQHARAVQPLLEAALVPALRDQRPMRTHVRIGADVDADIRPNLTHREQQIARLVRNGLSNKEIARDLALAQPTVKTHLLRMFRKLGVSSRTEMIGALFL
ncbi:HTH-type transcriptional regulator MalT [Paraburkholderia domus]|jgi:DNA-binding CsgD family transcriptional regulator|uniref:helix-turn-helix transcriptional regulator n=1 Tax=Paraburkholderia domus TaxID=2793075 RepID=UPI001911265E|nr:helix-turn-helix transcriptional regulator [Paraburkholderia domus]MBK5054340.1 helix-turn-helix transcriptional regulator [Burkholderia sp. R-70006]MBK5063464.1 helix-turn-helix transcriptional regulator [Burkholderia sp. R-70199]MBK5088544.1 helix-turn-helix transcriptional regulator [Burkholderia sp. R-69927]MBK5184671.1 helix-turn-helix transcriptional regulator [Burkholderia sp. R-69749]MCI0148707.1 helix-turn-helix transcriptional regulator [Paraburkholderia sediminicola]